MQTWEAKNQKYKVKSFLGTLGTKIFHANADIDTNHYASDLFGQAYTEENSRSVTTAGNFSVSKAKSFKLEKIVRPENLVSLKTGGSFHQKEVEGYFHQQGRCFEDGLSFKKITFFQEIH